jgi:hypothetical protein
MRSTRSRTTSRHERMHAEGPRFSSALFIARRLCGRRRPAAPRIKICGSSTPPFPGSELPIDLEWISNPDRDARSVIPRGPVGGVVPPLPCAIGGAPAEVSDVRTSRAGGAASCGLHEPAERPRRRPHPAGCHRAVGRGKGCLYAGFALKTARVTGGVHAASLRSCAGACRRSGGGVLAAFALHRRVASASVGVTDPTGPARLPAPRLRCSTRSSCAPAWRGRR